MSRFSSRNRKLERRLNERRADVPPDLVDHIVSNLVAARPRTPGWTMRRRAGLAVASTVVLLVALASFGGLYSAKVTVISTSGSAVRSVKHVVEKPKQELAAEPQAATQNQGAATAKVGQSTEQPVESTDQPAASTQQPVVSPKAKKLSSRYLASFTVYNPGDTICHWNQPDPSYNASTHDKDKNWDPIPATPVSAGVHGSHLHDFVLAGTNTAAQCAAAAPPP